MKYKDCHPIDSFLCTAWRIRFEDGKDKLQLWHKDAKIEDVVEHNNTHFSGSRFTVQRMDVGEFNLHPDTPVVQSYSGDARKVNQNMRML